jgi:hypothetical protein
MSIFNMSKKAMLSQFFLSKEKSTLNYKKIKLKEYKTTLIKLENRQKSPGWIPHI